MARIRTIKPEFPQSESMGRVSRDARLLFVQLWTICDDAGRTRAASRMLASLLFPYDDDAPALIDGWLDELEREECIWSYRIGGSIYLQVANWPEHQKVDRPSGAKCPDPREGSRVTRESSSQDLDRDRDRDRDQYQDHDPSSPTLPPTAERIATSVPSATRVPPVSDEHLRSILAAWNRGSGQRLTWNAKHITPCEHVARHGPSLADVERAAAAYVASLTRGFPPSFPRFADSFDRWLSHADNPSGGRPRTAEERTMHAAQQVIDMIDAAGAAE
jgi:hypothetical protein